MAIETWRPAFPLEPYHNCNSLDVLGLGIRADATRLKLAAWLLRLHNTAAGKTADARNPSLNDDLSARREVGLS